MPASIPPQLKPITPFIRRAEEIERVGDSRTMIVAYYCRAWAMEVGIPLNDKSAEVQGFLGDLIGRLESDRASIPGFKDEDGKLVCENFAYEVFKKADDEDRAGLANKNTARSFYAAGTFFEIMKQFGKGRELDPETKKTSLYAKWKATDILKAIKEGRTPVPGPPGGFQDEAQDDQDDGIPSAPSAPVVMGTPASDDTEEEEDEEEEDDDIPSAPTTTVRAPSPPPVQQQPSSPPAAVMGLPVSPKATKKKSSKSPKARSRKKTGKLTGKQKRADAIEFARFAIRAIEMDEVDLAMDRLQEAMAALE